MTSPRSSSGSRKTQSPSRPERPRRLKPDLTGADPLIVMRSLAHEARFAAQIDRMPQAALAQALAAIDVFNKMARLPPIYPHLVEEMRREIERQRIA